MSLPKESKKFLTDLLKITSVAGMEEDIQHKWLEEMKSSADKLETDVRGNAYAILNPDKKFKIMLAGHCDEIGFVVKRISEEGFIYFDKVGGISPKILPGMQVEVFGYKKKISGIVGCNAQHHGGLKEKIGFGDLFLDCGAKDQKEIEKYVRIGDYATYKSQPEMLMKNRIAARGIDNRSGAFIVGEVIKRLAAEKEKLNVCVYSVSTVSEEVGLQGAYYAAANIEPDMALACDVTFATDYPGVDTTEHGNYALEGGPVLAKGAPINKIINEKLEEAAKAKKIDIQWELTPSGTGTDADRIRFTGKGVPVALVSLPIRYMHAPYEVASLDMMEKEIELICEFIRNLKGDEDLRPVRI